MKNKFLKKAKENPEAAEMCYEKEWHNACASRLYCSVFQAAIAALLHSGITRDKFEHKQVQADFSGELIRDRKVYPAKFKSYLPDMQTVRNRSEYTGDEITGQIAHRWLGKFKRNGRIDKKGNCQMMNFKQKELVDRLFNAVKEKFPEMKFLKVTESPEDPADLWVNITTPMKKEKWS